MISVNTLSVILLTCASSVAQSQETHRELALQFCNKATVAVEKDQWDEASKWFKKSIEADGRLLPAHQGYQLVEYYYFERTKKIREEYRKLANQHASEALFQYLFGCVAEEGQGDLMNRALALDSSFAPAYAWLARKYFLESNNDSTGLLLTLALRHCPDDADIWGVKYALASRLNDRGELRRTIQLMSERVPISTGMAVAYRQQAKEESNKEKKTKLFQKVMHTDSFGMIANEAFLRLVELYEEDDWLKAESFAWITTSFHPRVSLDPMKGLDKQLPVFAYEALWNLYLRHDSSKAILLAKEIVKLPSENYFLYHSFGAKAALQDKDPVLSTRLLQRAETLATPERMWGIRGFGPPSRSRSVRSAQNAKTEVLSDLGWAYHRAGNNTEALRALKRATGQNVAYEAKIKWRIGQVYEKLNKPSQAIESYIESLSFQEDPEVRTRLSQLASTISGFSVAVPEGRNASIDAAIASAQIQRESRASEFSTQLLDGTTVSLKALRGKIIILDFWATWCGPCIAELPHLQELYTAMKDKNEVFIVALSTETSAKIVREFVQKQKYSFPVGLAGGAASKFEVRGIPTIIVIDKTGLIRYRHVGYDPSIDFVAMMRKEIEIVSNSTRR